MESDEMLSALTIVLQRVLSLLSRVSQGVKVEGKILQKITLAPDIEGQVWGVSKPFLHFDNSH